MAGPEDMSERIAATFDLIRDTHPDVDTLLIDDRGDEIALVAAFSHGPLRHLEWFDDEIYGRNPDAAEQCGTPDLDLDDDIVTEIEDLLEGVDQDLFRHAGPQHYQGMAGRPWLFLVESDEQ